MVCCIIVTTGIFSGTSKVFFDLLLKNFEFFVVLRARARAGGAKNIVPLLRKAEVAIVHGEKKENKPITNKWIRMFSPMIFNKGVYIATITIKESKKIYIR